jgi:hypothetical protein
VSRRHSKKSPSPGAVTVNFVPECPTKIFDKKTVIDVYFTKTYLSSVTLDKDFVECFIGFTECFRHSAK